MLGFMAIRHGLTILQLAPCTSAVGIRNVGGHSLLQLAQERGKDQCAQVLLREGAKP